MMPSEEYSNDSYLQTDQDSVVEHSSQVEPVETMFLVEDFEGSEQTGKHAQSGKTSEKYNFLTQKKK